MSEIMKNTATRESFKVIGVGGCGCNVVQYMARNKINNMKLICAITEVLNKADEISYILLDEKFTKGQGARLQPAIGRKACIKSKN